MRTLRTQTRHPALRLGLAGATVALVASGCATTVQSGSAGTGTPASTSAAPSPVKSSNPAPAKAGCPVDAATLETAFKANAALSHAIILGSGLRDVTCFQDFAVARTTPTNVDAARVLFSYDKVTGVWTAVKGGTVMACAGIVPPAVIAHLPLCASS